MSGVHYGEPRAAVWEGGVYLVRDVRNALPETPKSLVRCEYAVMDGPAVVWLPCVEGVEFAAIKPLASIM